MVNRRSFLAAMAMASLAPSLATPAPSNRIRIGQIGTSHAHASGKMQAIRSLPNLYEVVGIAEPIQNRQHTPQNQPPYDDLRWMTEDALLSDKSIEALVIETTLQDSPRAARAAIHAGKHLHLDKPGAASHAEFTALRLEAQQRSLTLQMGYMLRYNPAFQLLFRAHREGWLGQITEIDASMGKLANATLRTELLHYPGQGMFELACHLVDAIVFLLGKPLAVHAFNQNTGLAHDQLNDNQMAVLEYSRTTVTIRCNHGDPFGSPHRRFQVVGTKGAMEIQPLESGQVTLHLTDEKENYKKGENRIRLTLPPGRYNGEFIDFARALQNHQPLAWSAEHDILTHATALRCAGIDPD